MEGREALLRRKTRRFEEGDILSKFGGKGKKVGAAGGKVERGKGGGDNAGGGG